MKLIGVWGNFGHENDASGQPIKVRNVYDKLVLEFGNDRVFKIDTTERKKRIKIAFETIKLLAKCKIVILIPAGNGIRNLAKLIPFFNFFFRRKIIVIPVGSSLPDVAFDNKLVRKFLKGVNKIYCQGDGQKARFNELGIKNVEVMNNFRKHSLLLQNDNLRDLNNEIKLCFFSRVAEDKGIFDAVEAVKMANADSNRFILDIYGPVYKEVEKGLFELIEKNKYIRYKGVASYKDAIEILANYHCLLFPTYYEGEGQAGALVESLFAGTPIIATKWKYNDEIVIEGKTGYLVDIKSPMQIKEKILKMFLNQKIYNDQVKECKKKAREFTDSEAPQKLILYIKILLSVN